MNLRVGKLTCVQGTVCIFDWAVQNKHQRVFLLGWSFLFKFCTKGWEALDLVAICTVMTDQQTGGQQIVFCLLQQQNARASNYIRRLNVDKNNKPTIISKINEPCFHAMYNLSLELTAAGLW